MKELLLALSTKMADEEKSEEEISETEETIESIAKEEAEQSDLEETAEETETEESDEQTNYQDPLSESYKSDMYNWLGVVRRKRINEE